VTAHTKRKASLIGKIFFIVHILKKDIGWNFVLDQVERLSAGRKPKYLIKTKQLMLLTEQEQTSVWLF